MNNKEYQAIKTGKWKEDYHKDKLFLYTDADDQKLWGLVSHFKARQKKIGQAVMDESPINLLKKRELTDQFRHRSKQNHLIVDCETDGLYGRFLSVAVLAVNPKNELIEVAYCYDKTVTKSTSRFVRETILTGLPSTLSDLATVFGNTPKLTVCPVQSEEELFEQVYGIVQNYPTANVYGEHIFPVEWRFFNNKRFKDLELNLVEVTPEIKSRFDKNDDADKANQHKAWYDAYKTYQALLASSQDRKPYSSHTFILPFALSAEGAVTDKLDNLLANLSPKTSWQKVEQLRDLPYFTQSDYALADVDGDAYLSYALERFFNDELLGTIKDSVTYRYRPQDATYYQILIHDAKESLKSYFLELDYALVRFLDQSKKLGFLVIACHNRDYPSESDVARINQYGRRIYDPFLAAFPAAQESAFDVRLINQNTRDSWQPSKEKPTSPSFEKKPKAAVVELLEGVFGSGRVAFFKKQEGLPLLDTVIDDRMFVHAHFYLDAVSYESLADGVRGKDFQEHFRVLPKDDALALYEQEKQLFHHIFIDNQEATYKSPTSIRGQLEACVYDRWVDEGTLYGITQHSMVMLTKQPSTPNFLFAYFYSEYLELVLFVLAQRMQIIDFSLRAGAIAQKKTKDKSLALQEAYVIFKNKYLLVEACPQEQAIELYQLLQKNLYVLDQKAFLDDQIQSLYEIGMTKQNEVLNLIGVGLGGLTIVTGLADFRGIFEKKETCIGGDQIVVGYLLVLLLLSIIVWLLFSHKIKSKR